MKITGLHVDGFGRLNNLDVSFDDGINIIYGGNESGKSTLAAFIYCMLFGTEGRYERFLPWSRNPAYGGRLDIVHEGNAYRIERDFLKKESGTKLTELGTQQEIECGDDPLSVLMPGLDAEQYKHTFFTTDESEAPGEALALKLRGLINDEKERQSTSEIELALQLLEKRKHEFNGAATEKRLLKLDEEIEQGESEEKRLDELARTEQEGLSEKEKLDKEIAEISRPSLFEEKEQEYYAHKERYKNYIKDLAESRTVSEQLEKTIRLRSGLEERSSLLPKCREELKALRSYLRENDETGRKIKQEIDKTNTQLMASGKDNLFRQGALIAATVVFLLLSLILYVGKKETWLILMFFLLGLASAGFFFGLGIGVKRRRDNEMEELARKRDALEILKEERRDFIEKHPSEEELEERLEKYLKEDGRIPEISEKEKELSERLEALDAEIESSKKELLDFFGRFGRIESLKEDVLKLQEDELLLEKNRRLGKMAELLEKSNQISERNMKIRMQIEAGEENGSRLSDLLAEKKKLLGELEKNRQELAAIELAADTIKELAVDDNKMERLLGEKAGNYASVFTKDRYSSVQLEDNLESRVGYMGSFVPVKMLSRGANAQIELAIRMAAGDALFGGAEMPMVFDDAFVYYDDERLAMTLLELSGHPGQKIILTCRGREEMQLSELGLSGKIIRL